MQVKEIEKVNAWSCYVVNGNDRWREKEKGKQHEEGYDLVKMFIENQRGEREREKVFNRGKF